MRGADKEKEVLCNSCGMKKIGLRIKGWFRFESRAEKINKKRVVRPSRDARSTCTLTIKIGSRSGMRRGCDGGFATGRE